MTTPTNIPTDPEILARMKKMWEKRNEYVAGKRKQNTEQPKPVTSVKQPEENPFESVEQQPRVPHND